MNSFVGTGLVVIIKDSVYDKFFCSKRVVSKHLSNAYHLTGFSFQA